MSNKGKLRARLFDAAMRGDKIRTTYTMSRKSGQPYYDLYVWIPGHSIPFQSVIKWREEYQNDRKHEHDLAEALELLETYWKVRIKGEDP